METPIKIQQFVSALTNIDRLKITGVVANEALTQAEISSRLEISPAETHHHLESLKDAGLILEEQTENGPRFTLNSRQLEVLARDQFAGRQPVKLAVGGVLNQDEQRLLAGFLTQDGRLRQIPLQGKKLQAVLKYAAGLFTAGRIYTEKEANQVLERLNPDTAMLRRNLVDYGFLQRERDGSAYWLSQEESR
ncbi:MAG: DUF2087 domain-containing protein [Anaerolineales bacterium]|jgi:biotin operon repressor